MQIDSLPRVGGRPSETIPGVSGRPLGPPEEEQKTKRTAVGGSREELPAGVREVQKIDVSENGSQMTYGPLGTSGRLFRASGIRP